MENLELPCDPVTSSLLIYLEDAKQKLGEVRCTLVIPAFRRQRQEDWKSETNLVRSTEKHTQIKTEFGALCL